MVVTASNVNDATMLAATLHDIRVPRDRWRARIRSDLGLADKAYPAKANLEWLRARGIAATIPERVDQIEKRQKWPDRPIEFGEERQRRYRGRT
ncbi:Transposase DDE domain-containing protein [Ruaniaceae bacterium KH17]|nr:Transposase DDE domain-containing protein [Ruaniaceae bacterium KH17]